MQAMRCTGCGGPLPKAGAYEVVTCTFCATSNAPGPRVVEKVVERVQVVQARPDTELACARCGGALIAQDDAKNAHLWVCSRCGGAWIDPPTIERLTRQRDDDLLRLARLAVGAFAPRDRDRRPLVACPFCKAAMQRHPIGGSVESYDLCPVHGAFFDHGELKSFVDGEAERRAGTIDADDAANAGLGWRWPWS